MLRAIRQADTSFLCPYLNLERAWSIAQATNLFIGKGQAIQVNEKNIGYIFKDTQSVNTCFSYFQFLSQVHHRFFKIPVHNKGQQIS